MMADEAHGGLPDAEVATIDVVVRPRNGWKKKMAAMLPTVITPKKRIA